MQSIKAGKVWVTRVVGQLSIVCSRYNIQCSVCSLGQSIGFLRPPLPSPTPKKCLWAPTNQNS